MPDWDETTRFKVQDGFHEEATDTEPAPSPYYYLAYSQLFPAYFFDFPILGNEPNSHKAYNKYANRNLKGAF